MDRTDQLQTIQDAINKAGFSRPFNEIIHP